jgi:hypothetical protein
MYTNHAAVGGGSVVNLVDPAAAQAQIGSAKHRFHGLAQPGIGASVCSWRRPSFRSIGIVWLCERPRGSMVHW